MKVLDEFRENRARLKEARAELDEVARQEGTETDASLAANAAVIDVEESLPWWQR